MMTETLMINQTEWATDPGCVLPPQEPPRRIGDQQAEMALRSFRSSSPFPSARSHRILSDVDRAGSLLACPVCGVESLAEKAAWLRNLLTLEGRCACCGCHSARHFEPGAAPLPRLRQPSQSGFD